MCKKEEKERLLEHLEKAVYRIDKIQEQCNKFDSVAQALDNKDTQLIIAKCFDILYEKIMKFKGYGIAENMYNTLSKPRESKMQINQMLQNLICTPRHCETCL